jgi:hypothetical protein
MMDFEMIIDGFLVFSSCLGHYDNLEVVLGSHSDLSHLQYILSMRVILRSIWFVVDHVLQRFCWPSKPPSKVKNNTMPKHVATMHFTYTVHMHDVGKKEVYHSISNHVSSMSGSQVHEYHKLPSTNPNPFLPRHQLQATRLPHHPSTAHHPASRRLPRRRASTRGPRGARQARRQRVPGEGREGEIPILGSSW